jgi:tetratricopeptide (TPR) repeat protein
MGRSCHCLIAVLATGIATVPALAGDVRRAEHYLATGMEAMKVGELSKAEDAFERARTADPTLPQPEVFLGQIAMSRGRFDDAEGCFLRAIELFKGLDENRRVEAQRDAMKTQDDIDAVSSGLAESEGKPGRRGMTETDLMRQRSQKERLEAKQTRDERDRQSEMKTPPVPVDLYMFLGNARMRAGRPQTAVDAYRDAIAAAPDAAEPHHNLAAALASSGQLEEALAEAATAERMGFAPATPLRESIEKALGQAPPTDPAPPPE